MPGAWGRANEGLPFNVFRVLGFLQDENGRFIAQHHEYTLHNCTMHLKMKTVNSIYMNFTPIKKLSAKYIVVLNEHV